MEFSALQTRHDELRRAYTFLSRIFDDDNAALEKRPIFYTRLLPLVEFDREREAVDLSQVVLTHSTSANTGRRALALRSGEPVPEPPMREAGSGVVQEKEKALLAEYRACQRPVRR